MQSVGEVMSIGRTFPESLQKAIRSLELGRFGLNADNSEVNFQDIDDEDLLKKVEVGTPTRLFEVAELLYRGVSIEALHDATGSDPWFLDQMLLIVEERSFLEEQNLESVSHFSMRRAKRLGFSDYQLGYLWGEEEEAVRNKRVELGVLPVFKTVDTCSAEFEAETPYHYSTSVSYTHLTLPTKA